MNINHFTTSLKKGACAGSFKNVSQTDHTNRYDIDIAPAGLRLFSSTMLYRYRRALWCQKGI